MSTKNNKSRNKIPLKVYSKNHVPVGKAAVKSTANGKGKEKDGKKRNPSPLKKMVLNAEFSTILKEQGDTLQEDIDDESFNPPLHSTAVYSDEEDISEKNEGHKEQSVHEASPVPGPSQQRSVRQNRTVLLNKTVSISEHRSPATNATPGGAKKTPQKVTPTVQEMKSFERTKSPDAAIEEELEEQTSPVQSPSAGPSKKKLPGKPKSAVNKKRKPSNKHPNKADQKDTAEPMIWSSEDVPRTARDRNELDIALFEFEKVVQTYRESTDNDVCRKAVNSLFLNFKEQLTTSIKDYHTLQDLKRKNTKIQQEIRRRQKRLVEVNGEIIKKRPRLNQLQKECSELEEKQDSLKNAKNFLDNLGQLQQDCRRYKAENPHDTETYGLSSLPALLLQTQGTMRAEQHFHQVNTQLQSFMDKCKEKGGSTA